MPEKPAVPSTDPAYKLLRRAMYDIARGSWNTPSRALDTPANLTARQYAQAAIRLARAEATDE